MDIQERDPGAGHRESLQPGTGQPGTGQPGIGQSGTGQPGTGRRSDLRTARAFRLLAVALRDGSIEEAGTSPAEAAADALVGLAMARDEAVLGHLLRPDPDSDQVTWTVACYQIGDLTPSTLRDFADPVIAVHALSACSDPSHLAAELIASSERGLRWTSMVRTGRRIVFQLPTAGTASDASADHPGALNTAIERWDERLRTWEADGGDDPAFVRSRQPDAMDTAPSSPSSIPPVMGGDLAEALADVSGLLRHLEAGQDRDLAFRLEILARLEAIEQRLSDVPEGSRGARKALRAQIRRLTGELLERANRAGAPFTRAAVTRATVTRAAVTRAALRLLERPGRRRRNPWPRVVPRALPETSGPRAVPR